MSKPDNHVACLAGISTGKICGLSGEIACRKTMGLGISLDKTTDHFYYGLVLFVP